MVNFAENINSLSCCSNQPWKLVPNHIRGPGGREIDRFRGLENPRDTPSGSEAWIGSVTRVASPPPDKPDYGCSEVILPDGRRMYLFEAIALDPEHILGKKHLALHGTNLGMLIKLLDAQEQYFLQAHPTRDFAKKMWGSDFGKEESWYVIGVREDVKEPPYILLGFKEGITRERFEELYRKDDIPGLENLCHKIPVKPGDAFFVGGGLIHALGEGCFVVEVQEPSDITVFPVTLPAFKKIFQWPMTAEDERLYDERTLGAFIYRGASAEENLKRWKIPPKTIREGAWGKEYYVIGPDQTGYFSFSRLDLRGRTPVRETGFPQAALVLEGEGAFLFEGGRLALRKGDEVFLPCHIPGGEVDGEVSVIFCHPEGAV